MTSSRRLYHLHSVWPTNIYRWRSLKDGEYKDSCGKFEELEEIIEGSLWVETGNGSRLVLKNASSHTQTLYKLKVSTLEDKAVQQGRAHESCELWDVEKRAGRILLFTREVEGSSDVELSERELLPEEDGSYHSDSDEDDDEVIFSVFAE